LRGFQLIIVVSRLHGDLPGGAGESLIAAEQQVANTCSASASRRNPRRIEKLSNRVKGAADVSRKLARHMSVGGSRQRVVGQLFIQDAATAADAGHIQQRINHARSRARRRRKQADILRRRAYKFRDDSQPSRSTPVTGRAQSS